MSREKKRGEQMGKIYNIGLFGESKSGKTTLGESLLLQAGAIDRMGTTNQGNTVLDFEAEEKERQISISLATAYFKKNDNIFYIVDTPGYMDFIGEQISGIEGVDIAVINIGGDIGIDVGTEKLWEIIKGKNIPSFIFVNKIDVSDINLNSLWAEIESFFGKKLALITYPIKKGDNFEIVNILQNQVEEDIKGLFQKTMDAIAELDDNVMEKYLEEGKLEKEEISKCLKQGILKAEIMPVLFGSSLKLIGIKELFDFIQNYLPSTDELPPVKGIGPDEKEIERERKVEVPLSGKVIKTNFDPLAGRLSYLRVFSGVLESNSQIFNSSKNIKERIGQLYRMMGKKQEPVEKVLPGEIAVVAKLQETETFDSFSDPTSPIVFKKPNIPTGAVSYSITPKIKGTEDKLGNALNKIVEEDLTINVFRDEETGETLLTGIGDLHIEITTKKFKNKFGVEVEKGIPKIAYKETITKEVNAEGKFKKQTGGRGQYGHCFIKIEPLPRGSGFEFVDKIFGGAIPRQYIPSVEKGIRQAMKKGVLAGYPLVDFRVTLYDGTYHPVDSSDIAFQVAGSMALQKGVQDAGPILLEPIVNVEIRVPQEFVGDVIGTINAKRGKVLDMTIIGKNQVIKGQVPLSEMANYTNELRSITSGKGSYSISFSHYEPVPSYIAEKIIAERKKEKEKVQ